MVAKTPSREKIIAAGAGSIFLCAYICKTKAKPPDKIQAYKIESISFNIFSNINSS